VIYCLNLPLAWVLRWQLPPSFISALLAGRALLEAEPAEGGADQQLLHRWVLLLAQPDDEARRIVLLEAEARLRRLARSYQAATRPALTTHSTKIEQTIALIARRFADPVGVPVLAAELGVHPNYLSTLFRRETGQTLSHYLTEYRLAHACALLVSTTDKIVDIAYAAGFGSVSQFHAVFRRHRGCSPRQYRLAHHPRAGG
jgi:AraC-like DNA-binding protein